MAFRGRQTARSTNRPSLGSPTVGPVGEPVHDSVLAVIRLIGIRAAVPSAELSDGPARATFHIAADDRVETRSRASDIGLLELPHSFAAFRIRDNPIPRSINLEDESFTREHLELNGSRKCVTKDFKERRP